MEEIITNPKQIEEIKAFWPDGRKPDPRTGLLRIPEWSRDSPGARRLNPMEDTWRERREEAANASRRIKNSRAPSAFKRPGRGRGRGRGGGRGGRGGARSEDEPELPSGSSEDDEDVVMDGESNSDLDDLDGDEDEGEFVKKAAARKFASEFVQEPKRAVRAQARDAGIPRPARDALNAALAGVVKRVDEHPDMAPFAKELYGFKTAKILKGIADYAAVVPEEEWMVIETIKKKCTTKADMYTDLAAFLADWDALVAMTSKYHTRGQLADPYYIGIAEAYRGAVGKMVTGEVEALGEAAAAEEARFRQMTDEELRELRNENLAARRREREEREAQAPAELPMVGCDSCGKWRCVTEEIQRRFSPEANGGADRPFYCRYVFRECTDKCDDEALKQGERVEPCADLDEEGDEGGEEPDDDPDALFEAGSDDEFAAAGARRRAGGVAGRKRKAGGGPRRVHVAATSQLVQGRAKREVKMSQRRREMEEDDEGDEGAGGSDEDFDVDDMAGPAMDDEDDDSGGWD